MRFKYLTLFAVLLFVLFWIIRSRANKDFERAKKTIILREIGHEILLHSGDSTSRVLPVKQIAKNEYQLQFENEFTFHPDSLVNTIKKVIVANKLSSDYIVNVIECFNNEIIFGYAISGFGQRDIIPCTGRTQVKKCYLIDLKFKSTGTPDMLTAGIVTSIGLLLGITFYRRKSVPRNLNNHREIASNVIRIGNYLFYYHEQYLFTAGIKTDLTHKEAKLLWIFASAPNHVIDRNQLQKEVWEDEGIIVGRSLDMFISKLRKKLELDPKVKIVNVHGKGYKLDIGSTIESNA